MFIKFNNALIEATGICFFKTEPQQDVRPYYEIQLQSTMNDNLMIREEFSSPELRDKRFAELESMLCNDLNKEIIFILKHFDITQKSLIDLIKKIINLTNLKIK